MKIWLTQIGETLPLDANVRKMRTCYLAERLSARGHDEVWWASAFDHMQKKALFPADREIEIDPHLRIKALTSRGYEKNISLGRYFDHFLLSKKMAGQFLEYAPPDLIIASMPDHFTAYEAVKYATIRKIPIIVDVRDEWPDVFLSFVPPVIRPLMQPFLVSDNKKVKYLLKNATAILSMMPYMLSWALTRAGREETWRDKVFYIGSQYAARPADAPIPEKFRAIASKLNGRCIVTFIGTMGSCYNPLIIAEVAKKMRENKNTFFVIAGNGTHFEALQDSALNCENIFLPGWVSEPEIQYLLSVSHIGVIPCTETIQTFPNKAYTYISAGLPILSSVQGELGNLIDHEQIGYTYPIGDHQTLTDLIDKLAVNIELRQAMSRNAVRIFKEKYDADVIYEKFALHVEKIAKERRI